MAFMLGWGLGMLCSFVQGGFEPHNESPVLYNVSGVFKDQDKVTGCLLFLSMKLVLTNSRDVTD